MNHNSILPQSFPITKSLLKSVRCSQQKYREFLREKESLRKQNRQCAQLVSIDNEIVEVKSSTAESIKISKTFTLRFWGFQMKLERKETSNCCQGKMYWKESPKKNRMKPSILKRLCRYSKSKKKDYVMKSYRKTCETLFILFFIVFVCLI